MYLRSRVVRFPQCLRVDDSPKLLTGRYMGGNFGGVYILEDVDPNGVLEVSWSKYLEKYRLLHGKPNFSILSDCRQHGRDAKRGQLGKNAANLITLVGTKTHQDVWKALWFKCEWKFVH